MDDLETKCIASLPFQLPFFFRYVDEIITAVPTNEIDTILNTFNSYNHKIQFTIEKEWDEKICFLDVLIIRDGQKIKTNWYQKSTCSRRLLNFYSHHPLNYKINVINHLLDRGITLSHITFLKENIQKIKNILLNNNYPTNFINHVIKKRINHLHNKNTCTHHPSKGNTNTHTTHIHPADQNTKYIPLPYVQGLSEKLSGILKLFNIKIALCNENNLFTISPVQVTLYPT